jgi:hypothetical protein
VCDIVFQKYRQTRLALLMGDAGPVLLSLAARTAQPVWKAPWLRRSKMAPQVTEIPQNEIPNGASKLGIEGKENRSREFRITPYRG